MREHPHLTLLRARVRGPPGPQAKEEVERPNAKSHHRFGSRFERVCRPSSGTRQARVAPARNANEPLGTVKRHGGSGTVPLSTRSVVALFSSATDKGFKLPGIPAPSLQTPRARIDHGRVCALCVTEAVDEAGVPPRGHTEVRLLSSGRARAVRYNRMGRPEERRAALLSCVHGALGRFESKARPGLFNCAERVSAFTSERDDHPMCEVLALA